MSISQSPPTGSKKKRSRTPRPISDDREEAPGPRRRDGRGHPVLASGVQRKPRRIRPPSSGNAGMRLKTSRRQVDRREPLGDDDHQWRRADAAPRSHDAPTKTPASTKRDRRSDRGDQHLGPAGHPVAADLRDAAEEPEPDAVDRDAAPTREQRVAQLVSRQRGDQQQRGDDADDPGEPERRARAPSAGTAPPATPQASSAPMSSTLQSAEILIPAIRAIGTPPLFMVPFLWCSQGLSSV